MNIRFSPDAARREMTPVDNLFFLHYMPEADGTFVKVYLYGLMQCYHRSLTEVQIGEALGSATRRCAARSCTGRRRGLCASSATSLSRSSIF